ncbi:unnamed protein product, partial [Effrenium voratum]
VPEPAAQGVTLDVAGLKRRMAAGELPACEAKLELAAEKWHCEAGNIRRRLQLGRGEWSA